MKIKMLPPEVLRSHFDLVEDQNISLLRDELKIIICDDENKKKTLCRKK